MANFYDFSSDKIDIFFFLLDSSSSMEPNRDEVLEGLRNYQKNFQEFDEAGSIVVNISKFDSDFKPGNFKSVKAFNIDYDTGGETALYYSIVKAYELLQKYIDNVIDKKNIIPRATFIVLSDGCPYNDPGNFESAKSAIEKMNYAKINTVFIPFGNGITSEFGENLGFMAIKRGHNLSKFIGEDLSEYCKGQSKSFKQLGSNFFSQMEHGTSQKYSQKTEQALEDFSWLEEL